MKYEIITVSYKSERDLTNQLDRLTESGCKIIQILDTYKKSVITPRELNDMEFNNATVLVEKPIQPTNHRYPMCEDQPAQIDCRKTSCKYHGGSGKCTNISPAITLNEWAGFVCWTESQETI